MEPKHHTNPNIGYEHETIVEEALRELVSGPKRKKSTLAIVDFKHFKPYSREDLRGMDFEIVLSCGITVPLQVKSSPKAKRRFERKGKMHHNVILAIVINGTEELQEVVSKLFQLLQESVNYLKRKAEQKICARRRKAARMVRHHSPCMVH